ncbi:MAG: SpoIID/LytB domain-containing protein [Phascolarctobacterium sp.]
MLKKIIITLLVALGYLFGAFGLSKSEAAELIRVALVQGQSTAELTCESEFEIQSDGSDTVLPKGKYFLHIVDTKLVLEVASENGKQLAFASTLYIKPIAGKALPKVNERAYKGFLRAVAEQDKLLLVNYVDIEQYLASVLPAKTMVVWPDEAIKAQAVAARSYALYQKQLNSKKQYDLTANDKELPYLGTGPRIEKAGITKLIAATRGQYLVDGQGLPIMAVTTSSSGGRTEGAAGALDKEISYLQSVADFDSDSPDYKWEHRATPALLEGQLAQRGYAVGKLNSVRLSPLDAPDDDRTATGRVRYVILSGSTGTVKITGAELADIIGLKSTLFDVETGTPPPETLKVPIEDRYGFEVGSKDIDIKVKEEERPVWNKLLRSYHMLSGGKEEKLIFHGRGKGSGLGLSAWGARGMVVENERTTYAQILEHYYPGTRLVE